MKQGIYLAQEQFGIAHKGICSERFSYTFSSLTLNLSLCHFFLPLCVLFEGTENTRRRSMTWIGSWRNQYGSVLEITDESNGRIEGRFRSAVDNRIKGQQVAVVGVHQGDLISFVINGAPHAKFIVA